MTKNWKIGLLGGAATLCFSFGLAFTSTAGAEEGFVVPETVAGTATEAVVGEVSLPSFQMMDASVRVKTPTGIRFETSISATDLAKLPANATFGTLIIPSDVLNGATLDLENADTLDAENVTARVWRESSTADVMKYSGVLVGTDVEDFPESYYNEEITARGYVAYTDSNDQEFVIYTSNTTERSLAYVAGATLKKNVGLNESDEGYLTPESVTYLTGIVDTVVDEITMTVGGATSYTLGANESATIEITGNAGIPAIITTTGGIEVDGNTVTATESGEATITATVGSRTATVTIDVEADPVYSLAANTMQNNGWNTTSITAEGDKIRYTGPSDPNWVGGIDLRSETLATIKQMAEAYGYTQLVVTVYTLDQGLQGVFANGTCVSAPENNIYVTNTITNHTVNDTPLQYTLSYTQFKDWDQMQIFWSAGNPNVLFTIALEKYGVTADDQTTAIDSTFTFADLNVAVTDKTGTVDGLTVANFTVESLDEDVLTYEDGVFTAKAAGTATVCVTYNDCKAYVNVTVLGAVYNLTAGMISGNDWGGGSVTTREDGKLVYHGQTWTSAVVLTDAAFANIKQMAETYGYTALVVTLYSADSPQILNIFANGVYDTASLNVNGATGTFTEDYAPIRYEVAYTTFKDWTAMQLIRSDWAAVNAVFTLTLEKYSITAENQYVATGSTINFADLNVAVTGATGAIESLTYADFTVTSLNTNVVTYENGVFTTKADGRATVRIEYKGIVTYIMVAALNATKVNLATIMGVAGLKTWYAPNATLTDLGGGRLKINNPTENNNCGWKLAGDQLALIRSLAAKFGYNKLTIEVYSNPNGVLAAQGGTVAGNFPDKSFFWQVGGSVITTEATDESPIVGTPRDDVLNGAENVITYWNEIHVGVHGIGSIEFSLFLEKV